MGDEPVKPAARRRVPDRSQVRMVVRSSDELLLAAADHPARAAWAAVERLGAASGLAADRRLLVALWLDAATEGAGSARELERLCGGVTVNHHALGDLRVGFGDALDGLLGDQRDRRGGEYEPRPTDRETVAAWRARTGTEVGKAVYGQRPSTSETVNADLKAHRGRGPFRVRGAGKAARVAPGCAAAYEPDAPRRRPARLTRAGGPPARGAGPAPPAGAHRAAIARQAGARPQARE